ncbi:MAG: hypothetical protein KAX16_05300 [Actinomycetia bacterium]|nr:hypothetical protein [Actinomycetes bacterium]
MLKKEHAFFGLLLGLIALAVFKGPYSQLRPKELVLVDPEIKINEPSSKKALVAKASKSKSAADIVMVPPRTSVLSEKQKSEGDIKESFALLESELTPDELQLFYTDLLLEDWIVWRDSLTEGIGWSGVFLQIDDKERRLAVFAVIKKAGFASQDANITRISIYKVEEV